MSAIAWTKVGFEDRARIDELFVRGAGVGALGALCAVVLTTWRRPEQAGWLAVSFAAAFALVAVPRLKRGVLVPVLVAAALAAVLASPRDRLVPYFFTVPLGVMLALEPQRAWRRAVALVGPSLGAAWAAMVLKALTARHLGGAGLYLGALTLVASGLFLAAGTAVAWLSFDLDPLDDALAPQPRAQQAWLRLRGALARLPKGAGRAQLEAVCSAGAQRCVAAREQLAAAEAQLDVKAIADTKEAVLLLEARIAETKDAELAGHLRQLVRVHRDSLEQLEGLARKRERAEARAAAEVAWLDTAAFSVELAPKSEAGLVDLARRLESLA